jgi:quercetin 2,3-dioxygenase
MKTRSVKRLLYANVVDMGGLPVRQPFPTNQVQQLDPFLLLHHADVKVPTHIKPEHAGVGPHPHRGFSPVTFIFKGGVHHRDSRGNDHVIYEGGAQWMNAGRGIIHSERPPKNIHEIGGRQEIIQLWINSSAKSKMEQPVYVPMEASKIPRWISDDNKIELRVFSGEVGTVKGLMQPENEINAATIHAKKDGSITLNLPDSHQAMVYLLDGKIKVADFGSVDGLHVVHFNQDGDSVAFEALEDTRILLISGKPINESVVSHGPFVMNTQTQIMEAMRDYQTGKMGVLIEE